MFGNFYIILLFIVGSLLETQNTLKPNAVKHPHQLVCPVVPQHQVEEYRVEPSVTKSESTQTELSDIASSPEELVYVIQTQVKQSQCHVPNKLTAKN